MRKWSVSCWICLLASTLLVFSSLSLADTEDDKHTDQSESTPQSLVPTSAGKTRSEAIIEGILAARLPSTTIKKIEESIQGKPDLSVAELKEALAKVQKENPGLLSDEQSKTITKVFETELGSLEKKRGEEFTTALKKAQEAVAAKEIKKSQESAKAPTNPATKVPAAGTAQVPAVGQDVLANISKIAEAQQAALKGQLDGLKAAMQNLSKGGDANPAKASGVDSGEDRGLLGAILGRLSQLQGRDKDRDRDDRGRRRPPPPLDEHFDRKQPPSRGDDSASKDRDSKRDAARDRADRQRQQQNQNQQQAQPPKLGENKDGNDKKGGKGGGDEDDGPSSSSPPTKKEAKADDEDDKKIATNEPMPETEEQPTNTNVPAPEKTSPLPVAPQPSGGGGGVDLSGSFGDGGGFGSGGLGGAGALAGANMVGGPMPSVGMMGDMGSVGGYDGGGGPPVGGGFSYEKLVAYGGSSSQEGGDEKVDVGAEVDAALGDLVAPRDRRVGTTGQTVVMSLPAEEPNSPVARIGKLVRGFCSDPILRASIAVCTTPPRSSQSR